MSRNLASLSYSDWIKFLQDNPETKHIWEAITQKYGSNFSQEEVRNNIFGILTTKKPDFSYGYDSYWNNNLGKKIYYIKFNNKESREIINSINSMRGVSSIKGKTINNLIIIVKTIQDLEKNPWKICPDDLEFETPSDDNNDEYLLDLPPEYNKPGFTDPTDPNLHGPNYKH